MRRGVGALCLSSCMASPPGLLTRWSSSPGRGQAQGPRIHPTPPLVPTGRLTSLAAFGRQHSLGARVAGRAFMVARRGSLRLMPFERPSWSPCSPCTGLSMDDRITGGFSFLSLSYTSLLIKLCLYQNSYLCTSFFKLTYFDIMIGPLN